MLESDAKEDVTKGQDFRRLTQYLIATVLPVEMWKLVSGINLSATLVNSLTGSTLLSFEVW